MQNPKPIAPFNESELRALVEVVLLVAYADGKLTAPELDALVKHAVTLAGGQKDAAAIEELVHEVKPNDPLLRAWRAKRLASLREVLVEDTHRRAAFMVALAVARADNGIGRREATTLAAAAAEFGLGADFVLDALSYTETIPV